METPTATFEKSGAANELAELRVSAKRIPNGEPSRVLVTIQDRGEVQFEREISALDEHDYLEYCDEAATELGVDVDLIEKSIADEVCRARRAILKDQEAEEDAHADEAAVDSEADGFTGDFISLGELLAKRIERQWLVNRVLVEGEVAIVGGPKKTLKTTILIDLAIALAAGGKFLGHFDVPKSRRVVLISGESGEATIQEIGRRVCLMRSRLGLSVPTDKLQLGFHLPRLSCDADLHELRQALRRHHADLVILDPLYLALLVDNPDVNPANIYAMGPLLRAAARACLDVGATPIFAHHTTKASGHSNGRAREALDLEHLSFSGVAEVARQWIVLSRRESFQPDVGASKLWMNVGGSAGHSGLYAIDVEEGVLGAAFGERFWKVSVKPASDAIKDKQLERMREEEAKRQEIIAKRKRSVLECLETISKLVLQHKLESAGMVGERSRSCHGRPSEF